MRPDSVSWPPATWFGWPSSRSTLLLWLGPMARDARAVGGREMGPQNCPRRAPRRTKLAGNDICFGKQIDFNFWGGKTAIFHSLPVTPLEA
jgi:hypothetical protein